MKQAVYVETTIVSYLTAWTSRDVVRAAQQSSTRDWWETQRQRFALYVSELVEIEASSGDSTAAVDRLKVLATLQSLDVTETATEIADALIEAGAIPVIASRDALHVGICAANGVDYLLTWNCRHLNNAALRDRIRDVCEGLGYAAPTICTPDELFEDRE